MGAAFAHVAVAEPGLHILDQAGFAAHAQNVAETGAVDRFGRVGVALQAAPEHAETEFVNELEALDAPASSVFCSAWGCRESQSVSAT